MCEGCVVHTFRPWDKPVRMSAHKREVRPPVSYDHLHQATHSRAQSNREENKQHHTSPKHIDMAVFRPVFFLLLAVALVCQLCLSEAAVLGENPFGSDFEVQKPVFSVSVIRMASQTPLADNLSKSGHVNQRRADGAALATGVLRENVPMASAAPEIQK